VVAQPLIIQDEIADLVGELFALPSAFASSGVCGIFGGGCTRRLDRVRGGTELVSGDVGHHGRLAGGICRVPGGSAQLSGRSHGVTSGRTRLRHTDLAGRPRPNLLDRLPGSWI
jgi:hypothetical protein